MKLVSFLILMVSLYSFSLLFANEEGKKLYISKTCITCHGVDGKKPLVPNYPKLNGQNEAYLIEQFKLIKSGKRSSGLSVVMKPSTRQVSDEEMIKISKYLSAVK